MTYKKVGDAIGPHVSKVATDSGHEFELQLKGIVHQFLDALASLRSIL